MRIFDVEFDKIDKIGFFFLKINFLLQALSNIGWLSFDNKAFFILSPLVDIGYLNTHVVSSIFTFRSGYSCNHLNT